MVRESDDGLPARLAAEDRAPWCGGVANAESRSDAPSKTAVAWAALLMFAVRIEFGSMELCGKQLPTQRSSGGQQLGWSRLAHMKCQ